MDTLCLSMQTLYLAIILLVIGQGLKGLEFVKKEMIIWLLAIISISINFIFYGISITTLIEALIATSISVFLYDLIKQTKILIENRKM